MFQKLLASSFTHSGGWMGLCLSITCHSAPQISKPRPHSGHLPSADQASRDLFLPSPRTGAGKCPCGGRKGWKIQGATCPLHSVCSHGNPGR